VHPGTHFLVIGADGWRQKIYLETKRFQRQEVELDSYRATAPLEKRLCAD
jgi:hypothetical protein